MPPQGLIYYPGILHPIMGSFTLTHGITPSVATVYMAPQANYVPRVGPLTLSYGGAQIVFPDCIADKISLQYGEDGRVIWAMRILDRRWKWKFAGRISGYYNVRRDNGWDPTSKSTIVKDTEKTPRELARLCLEALGERGFDVRRMPNELLPEIEWDYELPAEALAKLCDLLGCRVVLNLNNSVSIEPLFVGRALPTGYDVTAGGVEIDPAERPDSIVVCTARVRWQDDFELEPVGEELDGSIKAIDQLSYMPVINGKRTWQYADLTHMTCVEDKQDQKKSLKLRELAKKSVFRWYRLKVPLKLYGIDDEIEKLDRVLPIEDKQIETMKIEERMEPRPAWVYGIFHGGYESPESMATKIDPNLDNQPQGLYLKPFSIDREKGIVKFSEPVYRYNEIKDDGAGLVGGELLPATLRLRTTVSLRDEDSRGWVRYEFPRRLPGPKCGTLPRYIKRDDIAYNKIHTWQAHWHNLTQAKEQAKHYLDAAEREYVDDTPATVSYAGFKAISPDGAIQEVTWTIDGEGRAFTRASRNKEEPAAAPTFAERRLVERYQEQVRQEQKTARQRKADDEKGRA